MSDLNKWIGSGRVTYTPAGTAVADIGLCSNRVWSKDGEKKEEPTFVDITLWGKQAEVLVEYLTKGAFLMVEARLQLDTWETDEGVKRSKLRLVADKINLGPKGSGGSGGNRTATKSMAGEIDESVPF
jgi:single-strand DNA-binding protein